MNGLALFGVGRQGEELLELVDDEERCDWRLRIRLAELRNVVAGLDHRPAQAGVLLLQRRDQPGHDQGGLAGAGWPEHGQEVVPGQPLAQPGDELLPAKEEGPLLVAESGQALEGAACVVGGRLLAQRQGVEAEVQRLDAEAVDLGQGLCAFWPCVPRSGPSRPPPAVPAA